MILGYMFAVHVRSWNLQHFFLIASHVLLRMRIGDIRLETANAQGY